MEIDAALLYPGALNSYSSVSTFCTWLLHRNLTHSLGTQLITWTAGTSTLLVVHQRGHAIASKIALRLAILGTIKVQEG